MLPRFGYPGSAIAVAGRLPGRCSPCSGQPDTGMTTYASARSLTAVSRPTVSTMQAPGKSASHGSVVIADCAW